MKGPPASDRMHQIGEVAEAVGLSLRTIRYYDEAELVPPSGRSAGGFRLYTDADVDRLRLVKNLKPMDLSIDEMRDLLSVRDRLADATTPRRDRADLVERLVLFASLAEDRCQRLREQLESSETVSDSLRLEVERESSRSRARH
jgi:MerR family copper efflux transcriptional regulator